MRLDHADLERYHEVTGLYMPSVLGDLVAIEKSDSIDTGALDSVYKRIVDVLKHSSDRTVPTCHNNTKNEFLSVLFFPLIVHP